MLLTVFLYDFCNGTPNKELKSNKQNRLSIAQQLEKRVL